MLQADSNNCYIQGEPREVGGERNNEKDEAQATKHSEVLALLQSQLDENKNLLATIEEQIKQKDLQINKLLSIIETK